MLDIWKCICCIPTPKTSNLVDVKEDNPTIEGLSIMIEEFMFNPSINSEEVASIISEVKNFDCGFTLISNIVEKSKNLNMKFHFSKAQDTGKDACHAFMSNYFSPKMPVLAIKILQEKQHQFPMIVMEYDSQKQCITKKDIVLYDKGYAPKPDSPDNICLIKPRTVEGFIIGHELYHVQSFLEMCYNENSLLNLLKETGENSQEIYEKFQNTYNGIKLSKNDGYISNYCSGLENLYDNAEDFRNIWGFPTYCETNRIGEFDFMKEISGDRKIFRLYTNKSIDDNIFKQQEIIDAVKKRFDLF